MLLTRGEAAALLGISIDGLRQWMDDPTKGLSEHVRLGATAERMQAGRVQGCLAQVPLAAIARLMLFGHRSHGYDRSAPKEPTSAEIQAKALELLPQVYLLRELDREVKQHLRAAAAGAARGILKFRRRRRAA